MTSVNQNASYSRLWLPILLLFITLASNKCARAQSGFFNQWGGQMKHGLVGESSRWKGLNSVLFPASMDKLN